MKVDLHCHSKHSKRATLWLMQKLGCPESFTDPASLYRAARRAGMTAVTMTDHNVIDGALEIVDLPGAFLGCEYTTYFPGDRCKVHVLAYGFTESQHRDLSDARDNIFDLVSYLQQHSIPHICAHPLYWVNDRLTVEHVEQLVLLFKNWELNGDLHPAMNEAVRAIASMLTPAVIGRLEDKHGITPNMAEPWRKNLTAGSDDHSALHPARSYTEVQGAETLDEFWEALESGQARVHFTNGTPEAFARNVCGIAYQFYRRKLSLGKYVHNDILLRFADRCLQSEEDDVVTWSRRLHLFLAERRTPRASERGVDSLFDLARHEAHKLILREPQLLAIVRSTATQPTDLDRTWYEFVNQVSNRLLAHFGKHLVDRVVDARILDVFHSLGSAGALYTMMAPYFVAYSHLTAQRDFAARVSGRFETLGGSEAGRGRCPRVAHFTDTFWEVNGPARTVQQQLALADQMGYDYTVVTCSDERHPRRRGLAEFTAIGVCEVPEYSGLRLAFPPFLQMLEWCYQEGFTHLHVSTPGPVGLAALGIARILRIPVSGAYHTAFPQYAKALTDDGSVEELLWKGMLWFYDQLDSVHVPSHATRAELIAKGAKPEKLRLYPRGVDTDAFHPSKEDSGFRQRLGIPPNQPILLYVGRLSKEKGLEHLAEAYRRLSGDGLDAALLLAGDGPYREEMAGSLAGENVMFLGRLEADAISQVYASASLLVFPSATDTFGNVVLEAQSSGLPVIVTDRGGPQENIVPGETGMVTPADDPAALADRIRMMLSDPHRLGSMGVAARLYAEQRSFRDAFAALWSMYTEERSSRDSWLDAAPLFSVPKSAAR